VVGCQHNHNYIKPTKISRAPEETSGGLIDSFNSFLC